MIGLGFPDAAFFQIGEVILKISAVGRDRMFRGVLFAGKIIQIFFKQLRHNITVLFCRARADSVVPFKIKSRRTGSFVSRHK